MRRSWSIAAAVCAAGCLSITQWDTAAHVPPRLTAFRYGDDPVLRVFSFFAPMTQNDAVEPYLAPWIWPLRIGVYLLTAALVYLAARSVTARTSLVGALLRWTSVVMLAFGVGEAAALTIVILAGSDDPPGIPLAIEIEARWDPHFWSSDGMFAGVGMSLWIGLPLVGLYTAHRMRRARRPGDPPGVLARTVGDLPGRARHVATAGIIPALCLAFVGGATTFVSRGDDRISLPEALSNISLYPRLRPEPPPSAVDDWLAPKGGEKPMIYSGISESWPVSTAVALVFLVLLWLLLWKVVSGLEPGSRHGTLYAFLFGWSVIVLTGALTALVHAALSRLNHDGIGFGTQVTLILPFAMRFGVVWGWLVGLAVAFSYRRSRFPEAVVAPTDTPSETTP
ncbi:hypothetical protein [Actinomadura mexicana]|uniref:Uncharacterized protein n=1 Tax=Actinomadura mexicana TaxID=134959 RepID=A0A238VRB7_9ACTN|nr:hypothetical protein [Actinomadura mexicana]SNR36902.1 hypothetical protein SAMN06265355_102274 [Actinomadura mexicana]